MRSPILVTGAAGRTGAVGRTVTELLLKQGKAVRAMVLQAPFILLIVLALLPRNLAVIGVGQRWNNSMKGDSDREIAIFTQALKLSSQEREAFLQRSCGGDEELQRKVEALLKAHGRLGNFLEEPPSGATVD